VFPGISKDGVPFNEIFRVLAGTQANPGTFSSSIDLTGYMFDLTGISGNERNKVVAIIGVTSDPNGPSVQVSNVDIFDLSVTLRSTEPDYAKGYFGNQIFSDTTSFDVDALGAVASGTIDLPSTTVRFEIENGVKVSARATLNNASNTNPNTGTVVDLTHPQFGIPLNIDAATGTWATLMSSYKNIVFDDLNSNVEAFLENLGSQNEVGYKIELNPWGNISAGSDEVFPNSRLRINLHANLPMTVGADQLVVSDTFDIDFEQDFTKTHVNSGSFILQASNAFPMSANIQLDLVNANGQVLHSVIGSNMIQGGQFGSVDPATGLRVSVSEVEFILTDAMVEDLASVTQIIVRSEFNTEDPNSGMSSPQQIPVDAFLGVKLRAKLTTENRF